MILTLVVLQEEDDSLEECSDAIPQKQVRVDGALLELCTNTRLIGARTGPTVSTYHEELQEDHTKGPHINLQGDSTMSHLCTCHTECVSFNLGTTGCNGARSGYNDLWGHVPG